MKWLRSLIFGLSALSLLLVACARLAPISRFDNDLSLPPSLDLADFSYASYARVAQAQRSSRLPTSTLTHYLSASFYPIESFSITPALGYYDQNYSQLGARTVNRSASLAMFYQPVDQNIRYTAFGSYDSESNRTWDIERRSYYIDGGLIWSLGDSSMARSSLSLGFAYNHYLDAVYSESNSEDLSLWLVFRVGSWAFPRVTPQFLFER